MNSSRGVRRRLAPGLGWRGASTAWGCSASAKPGNGAGLVCRYWSTVYSRAIAFADVDVQLKHHTSKDKWVVEIYESNGKPLLRAESLDGKNANELATALLTIQALLSQD